MDRGETDRRGALDWMADEMADGRTGPRSPETPETAPEIAPTQFEDALRTGEPVFVHGPDGDGDGVWTDLVWRYRAWFAAGALRARALLL